MAWRLILILVPSCLLMCINITLPFLRHNESSHTQTGKLSRSFLKFGLNETGGIPLDASGNNLKNYPDSNQYHYSSHPPGHYYLGALFMALLGDNEIALRIMAILAAAISIYLFYRCIGVVDGSIQLLATFLFSFNAMFVYNSVSQGEIVVAQVFILASILFYLQRKLWLSLVFQAVACYFDWQGYYLALVFLVHSYLIRKKFHFVPILMNVLFFGLFILHLYLVDTGGSALRWLFSLGSERAGFSLSMLPNFIVGETREILLYFSLVMVLLCVIRLFRVIKSGCTQADLFAISLLPLGLHELFFNWYASRHDYFTYLLGPFFAVSAALTWRDLLSRSRAVAAVLLVLFLAQNSYFIINRMTRSGGYEFYYEMARSVRNVSQDKHDKILVLTHTLHFYTPFYCDRYYITYDWTEKHLVRENTDPFVRKNINIIKYIEENPDKLDYAILTTKGRLKENTKYFKNVSDDELKCPHIGGTGAKENCFHLLSEDSELYRFLESRCERKIPSGAFILFKLKK